MKRQFVAEILWESTESIRVIKVDVLPLKASSGVSHILLLFPS